MKKFVNFKSLCALALCFVMLFALCACNDTDPLSTNDDTSSEISAPADSSVNSSIDDDSDTTTSSVDSNVDTSSKDEDKPVSSSSSDNESSKPSVGTTPSTPITSTPTPSTPTPSAPTPSTPAQKTAKELIVGKWRGAVDMAPMFSEEMGFEFKGDATVWCDMEFTSDGAIYEIVNRVSLKEAYFNVYTEWVNNLIATQGLTIEQFEASAGMSFDEYINALVETSMQMVPISATHSYKFEGSNLYILQQGKANFENTEYSFEGDDKLILNQDGINVTYNRNK